ncbi:hypothetical protein BDV93DRAFT_472202 [Ceratobasidium sp. AG-I]|nr:hypothetical protein BDV93DRAFT_472202 [Ceratobasidium sp. AG-I]
MSQPATPATSTQPSQTRPSAVSSSSTLQTDSRAFQTDASRRTALPHASLKSSIQVPAVDSETFLQNHEEEWNRQVDVEVEALAECMADLVGIASIEGKDRFQIAQEAFQAECRAESMAMAANSLLSITHSLKLMFLLGDEQYITQRREERLRGAITDISAAKSRVEKAWDGLREPRVFNAEEYAKENPVQGDT